MSDVLDRVKKIVAEHLDVEESKVTDVLVAWKAFREQKNFQKR